MLPGAGSNDGSRARDIVDSDSAGSDVAERDDLDSSLSDSSDGF
jgi:hypothetical protein